MFLARGGVRAVPALLQSAKGAQTMQTRGFLGGVLSRRANAIGDKRKYLLAGKRGTPTFLRGAYDQYYWFATLLLTAYGVYKVVKVQVKTSSKVY